MKANLIIHVILIMKFVKIIKALKKFNKQDNFSTFFFVNFKLLLSYFSKRTRYIKFMNNWSVLVKKIQTRMHSSGIRKFSRLTLSPNITKDNDLESSLSQNFFKWLKSRVLSLKFFIMMLFNLS